MLFKGLAVLTKRSDSSVVGGRCPLKCIPCTASKPFCSALAASPPGHEERTAPRHRHLSPWHLGRSLTGCRETSEGAFWLPLHSLIIPKKSTPPGDWSQGCYQANSWMTPGVSFPLTFPPCPGTKAGWGPCRCLQAAMAPQPVHEGQEQVARGCRASRCHLRPGGRVGESGGCAEVG